MMTDLATGHLRHRDRLHTLIGRHDMLEIHHVMLHVGLSLRLIDYTCIVFRLFWHVGVSYTKITNIFGWTRLETFDGTLYGYAPLLNSGFAIRFHQWR